MKKLWILPAAVLGLLSQQALASDRVEIVGPEVRHPSEAVDDFGNPLKKIVRELCAIPAGNHSIYIPAFATDLVNDYGEMKLTEYEDGSAVLEGLVHSRSKPWKEMDVYVEFTKLEGSVDLRGQHSYQSTEGELTGIGESPHFKVGIERRGAAFSIGYEANKKNKNYGAAGWFDTYGSHKVHGDINIDLISCSDKNYPPKKETKIGFEILAANGSACPGGDVSLAASTDEDQIDLRIPMISLEGDKFARKFCQTTVLVKKPAGLKVAVKQYDAWYEADLSKAATARITGAAYFQGDSQTQTFETKLTGKLKKKADIHLTADKLQYSDCSEDARLNLKTSANLANGWGALTIKSLQRYQLVWKECH